MNYMLTQRLLLLVGPLVFFLSRSHTLIHIQTRALSLSLSHTHKHKHKHKQRLLTKSLSERKKNNDDGKCYLDLLILYNSSLWSFLLSCFVLFLFSSTSQLRVHSSSSTQCQTAETIVLPPVLRSLVLPSPHPLWVSLTLGFMLIVMMEWNQVQQLMGLIKILERLPESTFLFIFMLHFSSGFSFLFLPETSSLKSWFFFFFFWGGWGLQWFLCV